MMIAANQCPACGACDARVRETRTTALGIRRRRRCHGCGQKWSTIEMVVEERSPKLWRCIAAPLALSMLPQRGDAVL